jgi:hypothetical protein
MNAAPPRYRRLVLEFGQEARDAGLVRTAAELARLLGVDLQGLFIEDESLLALAAWPFARELRLPTHEWHKIDPEAIAAELRAAAAAADRLLADAVAALDIPGHFEVIRGEPVTVSAAFCHADDIFVFVPTRPTSGHGPASLAPRRRPTAPRAAGAVLVVPNGRERRAGPVIAVLASAADPGLEVAAHIAAAAGEDLRILLADPARAAAQQASERAARVGLAPPRVRVQEVARSDRGDPTDALPAALAGIRERLIVLGHGITPDIDAAARLALRRGVPVLVPGGAPGAETPEQGEPEEGGREAG